MISKLRFFIFDRMTFEGRLSWRAEVELSPLIVESGCTTVATTTGRITMKKGGPNHSHLSLDLMIGSVWSILSNSDAV